MYAYSAASSTISQVSEVEVWAGMTSFVMKKAFWISVPQRIPQVSRLRRVLAAAWRRKEWRSGEGRNIGRRAAPDSVCEVEANWWVGSGVEGRDVVVLAGAGSLFGRGGGLVGFGWLWVLVISRRSLGGSDGTTSNDRGEVDD